MANAKRDANQITTLICVSNADGVTPVDIWADPVTHRMLVSSAGGGTVAGSDTQVQFNDGGAFGADAGLTYNKTTDTLTAGNLVLTTALPVAQGGTGSTTAADARTALGLAIGTNVQAWDADLDAWAGKTAPSGVVVGDTDTQTLVNKTLTAPVLNTATIGTSLLPTNDDGAPLGSTTKQFSDLFLASGAVINFNNGDITLTHSADTLTLAGGTLVASAFSGPLTGDVVGNVTGNVSGTSANVTGTVAVANGGTGNTTFTAYAVLCAGTTATGAFQNVSGVGTAGQLLVSNGAGQLPTWQTVAAGTPTAITVADEASDTSCFIAFFTAATGDLGPKTNTGLTFNSSTAVLTAGGFVGPLTGDVTGNVSGNAATVTGLDVNAGTLEIIGDDALILRTSAATDLTLPTTGTVMTADSTATMTNKTFDANGTGNSLSNVDVADLADGTDGELITWDASGNPATVAAGTSGQVLTSNGAGAAPTFQDASSGVPNSVIMGGYADGSANDFCLPSGNTRAFVTYGTTSVQRFINMGTSANVYNGFWMSAASVTVTENFNNKIAYGPTQDKIYIGSEQGTDLDQHDNSDTLANKADVTISGTGITSLRGLSVTANYGWVLDGATTIRRYTISGTTWTHSADITLGTTTGITSTGFEVNAAETHAYIYDATNVIIRKVLLSDGTQSDTRDFADGACLGMARDTDGQMWTICIPAITASNDPAFLVPINW